MVTVAAVALGFGIPCAAALLALRWWLDAHPKAATPTELEQRIRSLEDWKLRAEFQQVRR